MHVYLKTHRAEGCISQNSFSLRLILTAAQNNKLGLIWVWDAFANLIEYYLAVLFHGV